eukprot:1960573-Pyramimonas_sp.AAC.1
MWNGCRDKTKAFAIRVRGDIPLPARMRKNAMSCLWGPVKVEFMSKGPRGGSLRMGCPGHGSGGFQIATASD